MTDQIQEMTRKFRQAQGLSYRALADKLNATLRANPIRTQLIHYTAIHYWEKGTRRPDQWRLQYIRDNTDDADIKDFASQLLEALRQSDGAQLAGQPE